MNDHNVAMYKFLSLNERLTPNIDSNKLSLNNLKDSVLVSISGVLNSCSIDNLISMDECLSESILNYGIKDLTSYYYQSKFRDGLPDMIKERILKFEPRIIPETFKLTLNKDIESNPYGIIYLNIYCQVNVDPVPISMMLKAEMDITSGNSCNLSSS